MSTLLFCVFCLLVVCLYRFFWLCVRVVFARIVLWFCLFWNLVFLDFVPVLKVLFYMCGFYSPDRARKSLVRSRSVLAEAVFNRTYRTISSMLV